MAINENHDKQVPDAPKFRLLDLSSFYNANPKVHTVTVKAEYNGIEVNVHVPVLHEKPGSDTLWEEAEIFFREAAEAIARRRVRNMSR